MITPTLASLAFNQKGLEAMGAASGQLAAVWAGAAPSYDAAAMTLTLGSASKWKSPVGGVLQWHGFGAPFLSDATGAAISGVVAVMRLHPQAALRLRRLIGQRYDGRSDGRASRPVPWFAAISGGDPPDEIAQMQPGDPPLAPEDASVGTDLTHGTLSFHDERGLAIDPVAVACLFRDLMRGFPALRNANAGGVADLANTGPAGSIGSVAALATGNRLAVADLFGGGWTQQTGRPGLRIGASGAPLGAGPHDWTADTIRATEADPRQLRFGLYPEGVLGTAAIGLPTFPATQVGATAPALERQFFRVMAVDLELHLLGNRSGAALDGVPKADEATTLEPAPPVRDGDTLEVLVDGQATTGAISEVGALSGLRLAASPVIETDVAFPPTRTSRWPAVPAPSGTSEDLSADHSARARSEATAAFVGDGADVVVSWPAGAVPVGAHIRVFPRVDPGPAVVPLAELDFARRGDGGAAIGSAAGVAVVLADPYRVGAGARPGSPRLAFDLLIVTRGPAGVRGRLFGGLNVPVGTGGVAPETPPESNVLGTLALDQRAISPAPLLGLVPTAPASGSDPVLAALGEAAPREAPRFRTMARTESIFAGHDGGAPGAWTSVLTPGFLTARSVRDDARLGNPGHRGGPEDHAPGVRATGRLGLDLARMALRRTHHLVTRLPELDAGRWAEPAAGTGTVAGAVLQNIAEIVESPELALIPEAVVHSLSNDWAGLISTLSPLLPPALASLASAVPAPAAGDRWVNEVKRDAFAAKHGRRDSQWAWRWAIAHARTLIYAETPLLGATGSGTGEQAVDLVALLIARLAAAPDLRVIIATPRRVPFGPGYEGFAQRHYLQRNAAVDALVAAAPKRVVVYHPVGFPGRPEVLRGVFGVVDDVWAIAGSSSLSRRGLTFDGSVDVAWLDRQLREGTSAAVREMRRRALARTLGVTPPTAGETPNANWVRTLQPRSAFELMREILERGGDGLIEPLWRGLPESEVLALDARIADPEGRDFPAVLGLFAQVLAGLGDNRV